MADNGIEKSDDGKMVQGEPNDQGNASVKPCQEKTDQNDSPKASIEKQQSAGRSDSSSDDDDSDDDVFVSKNPFSALL